jgi:O-antigen ligase
MSSRDQIVLALCAATVGFCALAFGGAVRWAMVAAAAGAIASAIPHAVSSRMVSRRSPLLLLLAIAIALTALQLVPLPIGAARVLAPAKVELVSDNAAALGEPVPSFVAASYDPPATLAELAKLCGYAALAFAAMHLARRRRGKRALAIVIVATALAVAVVALAHAALGLDEIYGSYRSPGSPVLPSPIINDNHLASLMAIAVPVALGLAVSSAGAMQASWIVAAMLCAAINLLASSRGGVIGLAVGVIATVVMILMQRREERRSDDPPRSGARLARVVVAVCALVLLGAFTADRAFRELSDTRVANVLHDPHYKVHVWERATAMLGDNPILGTGRGAFEPAFTRYAADGELAYSHAENSYLQAIVDWGVLGGLAIVGAGVALAVVAFRRWRRGPIEAGALGALAGLAVHELADFSLELPVIAMLAILAIAIVLPAVPVASAAAPTARAPARGPLRWLQLGAAATVCALAATSLAQPARAAAADVTGPPAEVLARAQAASERHPADYLLVGRVAQALMALGDPRAPAVLSRALYLNPFHAGLHRTAAQMLARSQRPQQARVEFALALSLSRDDELDPTIADIEATFPDPADAARALPDRSTRAPRIIDFLLTRHLDAVTFEYARRLTAATPDDPDVLLLAAGIATMTKHPDMASAWARGAHQLRPDARSAIALGQAMALAGDAPGAIAAMRAALSEGPTTPSSDRNRLLGAIADVEIDSGALADAASTLDELEHAVVDTAGMVALHQQRARLDDRLRNPNQASWERDQAQKLRRGDPP